MNLDEFDKRYLQPAIRQLAEKKDRQAGVQWDNYPLEFRNWIYQVDNRAIYKAFAYKARLMAERRKRYSARAIIHAIRWETDLHETDKTFKINNNWTPYLARLFMELNPQYEGFFEVRHG